MYHVFQMATSALVDEILVPKDVLIPSPGTCMNGTLYGKRDFVDVTKLRILRWGVYPGGHNVIIRIPVKKEAGESESGGGVATTEVEVRVMRGSDTRNADSQ